MTLRKMQQIRMFAGGAILVRPRCDRVVVRFRSAPEWWRGTKPVPFPGTPARAALRGVVSQADIPSFAAPPAERQPLGFEQAQARGLTISLDDRHLWVRLVRVRRLHLQPAAQRTRPERGGRRSPGQLREPS